MTLTYKLLLSTFVLAVSGQHFQLSPCPNVFQYVPNGGRLSGFINQLVPPGNSYWRLDLKLVIVSNSPSVYDGELKLLMNEIEILNVFAKGGQLKYLVDFPITHSIPLIKSITINNIEICKDTPEKNVLRGQNQYFAYVNLNNIVHIQGGGIIRQYHNVEDKFPPKRNNLESYVLQELPSNNQQHSNQIVPNHNILEKKDPPHRRNTDNHTTANLISKFASLPSGSCGKPLTPISLIVKGEVATPGDWPWLSAIYRKYDWDTSYQCVGSLISNKHVLTAGHCLYEGNVAFKTSQLLLKLGVYDISDWGENVVKRDVEKIYIHPKYEMSSIENDIGVLEFKPVTLNSNLVPICLWSGDSDLTKVIGRTGTVVGWGIDEDGEISAVANQISMPIVSSEECYTSNPDLSPFISTNTFCAGKRDDSGPCSGDSGGGLYIRSNGTWRIRGIVSLSLKSTDVDSKVLCSLRDYVVFVDVAKYIGWIENIIK
ncbi:chymotrypsinogen B2-like [Arctopsyche grandis]|uniref:chymotrypsinogen B2-like n=1 Tax=Arctopsyche grandis TaxID=121162 RepID=UPI00406D889A